MTEIREEQAGDGTTLIMSGELTVAAVNSIRTKLLKAVQTAPAVRVRLENVGRMDTSFLQLLCSAHRAAANKDKSFTISGDRERFLELLKKSGFQRHIGCRESGRHPCLWLAAEAER